MFSTRLRSNLVVAPAKVIVLSLCLITAGFAQTQASPDNSGTNKAQNKSQTADQQKEKTSDRELTAKIRRALIADKSLSTYGHNVKIIVVDGAVTLKGPVHSDQEKQNIEAKAGDIAGHDKVTNQITIKQ